MSRSPDSAPGMLERASFLRDLFAQLWSDHPRIDAGPWCAYNAFFGTILLGGALVLRLSGSPDLLGTTALGVIVAAAVALIAAAILPLVRPPLVRPLLAVDGLLVIALTGAFAVTCVGWARETGTTRSFRYLPGLITAGATYGAALWADFGTARAHARRWRLAGFVLGLALDAVVSVLVIAAALRA